MKNALTILSAAGGLWAAYDLATKPEAREGFWGPLNVACVLFALPAIRKVLS